MNGVFRRFSCITHLSHLLRCTNVLLDSNLVHLSAKSDWETMSTLADLGLWLSESRYSTVIRQGSRLPFRCHPPFVAPQLAQRLCTPPAAKCFRSLPSRDVCDHHFRPMPEQFYFTISIEILKVNGSTYPVVFHSTLDTADL